LEIYLNVAEWGEGIFGVEAAAHHYYGKPASALGPEESARQDRRAEEPRYRAPPRSPRWSPW
ncbi:MAG: transglycosylase domain-containing protein, partial [Betaproteobacteria bacterium]|nr:transglycosylase domain-containing protein [Betaproteobacteria bacterium]